MYDTQAKQRPREEERSNVKNRGCGAHPRVRGSLLLLLAPSGLGACVRAEFVRFHARLWATERMHLPEALSAWCVAVRAWYEDSWRC